MKYLKVRNWFQAVIHPFAHGSALLFQASVVELIFPGFAVVRVLLIAVFFQANVSADYLSNTSPPGP